jgi:hypothetical protein
MANTESVTPPESTLKKQRTMAEPTRRQTPEPEKPETQETQELALTRRQSAGSRHTINTA